MADQSNYQKDFPVSWDEIHRNSKALAWRLLDIGKKNGGWKGVIAVARGGLVPACIVARELGIHMVETYCINSYDHKDQGSTKILKTVEEAGDGTGWLVIDDLVDTGNTFRIIRESLPNAHFGCVYAKPSGRDTVDTFITEVSQDTWIHFPWDLEAQYRTPLSEM